MCNATGCGLCFQTSRQKHRMEVNDQFAIDKVNFTLVPIISSVKLYKDKLLFVPAKEDKRDAVNAS